MFALGLPNKMSYCCHYRAVPHESRYRKIPIISPGLIFVQKAVFLGLFSGELIFGGAYYWKEFCVSNWVGLENKNSLKHYENSLKQLKTASTNSPRAYIWEGVLSEGFLRLRFGGLFSGGLIFAGAYRNFTGYVVRWSEERGFQVKSLWLEPFVCDHVS